MANPLRRFIEVVFDKASGNKATADAKASLSGIDGAVSKIGDTIKRIGGLLAAAFGIHALVEFGKSAVKSAMDAEKAWALLRGTINSSGADFDAMEARIRAAGTAFRDATVFDDEAFASSLARMTVLTGDVEASLNNMGMVANVAARFFGGELAPAVELVSKVMNGNVMMLQRMGIHVKDAQEGLDVLASRSMGGASAMTKTFSGQLDILNREWDDFKKALGFALIDAANGESILSRLTTTLKDMIGWVNENRDTLSAWGKAGISTVEIVGGSLTLAFGAFVGAVTLLSEALIDLIKIFNILPGAAAKLLTGSDPLGAYLDGATARAEKLLGLSGKLISMGAGAVGAAFTSGTAGGTIPSLKTNPPRLSSAAPPGAAGAQTFPDWEHLGEPLTGFVELGKPAMKMYGDLIRAQKEFADGTDHAAAMSRLLGPAFDATGEAAKLAQDRWLAFKKAGLDPASEGMLKLEATAKQLTETASIDAVMRQNTEALKEADSAFSVTGDAIQHTTARIDAYRTAIIALKNMGTPAAIAASMALTKALKQEGAQWDASTEQAKNYALAVDNLSSLIAGAVGGELKEVAKAKAKENLLLAAEQLAMGFLASLSLFGAVDAPKHFAAAAKFSAIAAGWGALGAVASGGSSGGGSAGASGVSGSAATTAETPQQDVNIYLVGPGFDAMNPAVQKVVYGAQQQARERYGENAKVNLIRRAS